MVMVCRQPASLPACITIISVYVLTPLPTAAHHWPRGPGNRPAAFIYGVLGRSVSVLLFAVWKVIFPFVYIAGYCDWFVLLC